MSAPRPRSRAGRLVPGLAAVLLLVPVADALWPRNAGWREAPLGPGTITIGIDASIAHAELILPVVTPRHDWRARLPPGSLPPGAHWFSIGWGDAAFYRATPTWGEFSLRRALAALFASEASLVHLTPLAGPAGRPIRLSAAEHARLVAFLEAEIAPGPALAGYGPDDVFLPGSRRYSFVATCNQWVGDALAAAGVRVGRWTPLAPSLMWRFEDREEQRHG